MSATIEGHERNVLIWALQFVDSPAVGHCRKWTPGEYAACEAVQTPTKLAELIVSEGRRLGFCVPESHDQTFWHQLVIEPRRRANKIEVDTPEDGPHLCFTLPEARAILATLLPLPDGAREQAEKVLRGIA